MLVVFLLKGVLVVSFVEIELLVTVGVLLGEGVGKGRCWWLIVGST